MLLQKLASTARMPDPDKYKSYGFVAFAPNVAWQTQVPPGVYAPAYRFVDINTGQDTSTVTLPLVVVP